MALSLDKSEKFAWISILLAVTFFIPTLFLSVYTSSPIFVICLVPLFVSASFGIIAGWRSRLVHLEVVNKNEAERFTSDFASDNLFNNDAVSPHFTDDSRRSFDRFILPIFTFLIGVAIAVAALLYIRVLRDTNPSFDNVNHSVAVSFSILLVLVGSLTGSYYVGLSGDVRHRLLRPVGQWYKVFSGFYGISLATTLISYYNIGNFELFVAKGLLVFIVVLGVELVINIVLEMFRPRRHDNADKPLFESALLAIITSPLAIARNIAFSLNYQFGLSISEAWMHRVFRQFLVPMGILLVTLFYILDCVILLQPNELGVKERFGEPVFE